MTNNDPDDTFQQAEKVIKDITKIFLDEQKVEEEARKAGDKAANKKENSLVSIADKLAGINTELDDETIDHIADTVAQKASQGNASIHKTRKSETKLLIHQRQNIKPLLEKLKEHRDTRREDDPKYSLAIRPKLLSGLRKMKKDDSVRPDDVVKELRQKEEYVPSDKELAKRKLDQLADAKALGVVKGDHWHIDPRAEEALQNLRDIIENGASLDPIKKDEPSLEDIEAPEPEEEVEPGEQSADEDARETAEGEDEEVEIPEDFDDLIRGVD